MIIKQVKFCCPEADTIERTKTEIGGIAVYESEFDKDPQYIICGCCGGIFESDDAKILRKLDWIPISTAILGE